MPKKMIKYIDLFAGVGGFHYGIEKAGELIQGSEWGSVQSRGDKSNIKVRRNSKSKTWRDRKFKQSKNTFECVYANEWDKYANSVYRRHYGKCDNRDIRTVKSDEIPDHDLLCAGFPCQSFSVAGKRGGFDDTRGTMFFEIARIAKQKRPRYLLLENVKGLLSHDKGKTFQTILGVLADLGYQCEWQVLNSKHFGVPQNRERVFIIGHLGKGSGPKVFPITHSNSAASKTKKLPEPISNCLRTNYSNGQSNETYIRQLNQPKHFNDRIYSREGIRPTLKAQGGMRQPKIVDTNLNGVVSYTHGEKSKLDDRTLEGEKKLRGKDGDLRNLQEEEKNRYSPQERELARQQKREPRGDMSELSLSSTQPNKDLQTRNLQQEKKKVRILRETQSKVQEVGKPTGDKTQPILQSARIRRLTPVETERLQGFPDDWTKYDADGKEVSDTQRYKMMGNAVTTNVIAEIARKLL